MARGPLKQRRIVYVVQHNPTKLFVTGAAGAPRLTTFDQCRVFGKRLQASGYMNWITGRNRLAYGKGDIIIIPLVLSCPVAAYNTDFLTDNDTTR